jgi:hypothetical protein
MRQRGAKNFVRQIAQKRPPDCYKQHGDGERSFGMLSLAALASRNLKHGCNRYRDRSLALRAMFRQRFSLVGAGYAR